MRLCKWRWLAARRRKKPTPELGSLAHQDRLAGGAIFLGRDSSVTVSVGELAECVRGRLSFAWLKQDVAVGVIIFERPAHQHPIALEQLQCGRRCLQARWRRLRECRHCGHQTGSRRRYEPCADNVRALSVFHSCEAIARRTALSSASARNGLASSGASGAVRLTASVSL